METKEMKRTAGQHAVEGLIQWTTMGMPSTLALTVAEALRGIAQTGECGRADDEAGSSESPWSSKSVW